MVAPVTGDGGPRGAPRRRRTLLLAACLVGLGLVGALLWWPGAGRDAGDPDVVELVVKPRPPPVVAPDVTGLTLDDAWQVLEEAGWERRVRLAEMASNDAPEGTVMEQRDRGRLHGGILVLSSGGPAVELSEVPAEAAELLAPRMRTGELVLVRETSVGTVYKVDHLLAGPCDAVAEAYRTFSDARYDDACY